MFVFCSAYLLIYAWSTSRISEKFCTLFIHLIIKKNETNIIAVWHQGFLLIFFLSSVHYHQGNKTYPILVDLSFYSLHHHKQTFEKFTKLEQTKTSSAMLFSKLLFRQEFFLLSLPTRNGSPESFIQLSSRDSETRNDALPVCFKPIKLQWRHPITIKVPKPSYHPSMAVIVVGELNLEKVGF